MKILVFMLWCLSMCGRSQAQNDHWVFNIEKLKVHSNATDTNILIYSTALWCAPCLEKIPALDSWLKKQNNKVKIVYLFDVQKFNRSTLERVIDFIRWDSTNIKFPAANLYSSAAIQVNSHKRMYHNLQSTITQVFPDTKFINLINLSSLIIIKPRRSITVLDLPAINKMPWQQRDSLLDSYIHPTSALANNQLP